MQPLISPVDHEARYHYQHEDEDEYEHFPPRENTRLLPGPDTRKKSPILTVFIFFMALFLVTGISIGIYLMHEQGSIQPISIPFELVYRENWGAKPPRWIDSAIIAPAGHLILTHTFSDTCDKVLQCRNILLRIQNFYQNKMTNASDLPFNFMISHDGETYEGRGWNVSGKIDSNLDKTSISVAVIGNFTTLEPSNRQLMEIKALINEALRRHVLSTNYTIQGRPFHTIPEGLFKHTRKWNNWITN